MFSDVVTGSDENRQLPRQFQAVIIPISEWFGDDSARVFRQP